MFPPAIKWLLIINAAMFLGPKAMYFEYFDSIISILGLVPRDVVGKFFIWQPVTYMFLHGNTWHIFMNMFILWMFGSELERTWGTKEFLKFYFVTGVGAGLFNLFIALFNNPAITIIGASGAIYGILVAYAMLFPNRLVYLYFFIPIKVKYLVIILIAVELLSTGNSSSGVAHFAHLGGALVGYLYLKQNLRWRTQKWSLSNLIGRLKAEKDARKREGDRKMMEEVDAVLDKINKVGYDNLTKHEKKILENASDKLSDEE